MDASLYGNRDPKNTKSKHKPINSSTASAFSSSLSSLISSTKTKPSSASPIPPNPLKRKSDIFSSHNRNVKARAAADHSEQQHRTKHDLDSVSGSELQRSKRKMEEKARLYAQMKRGEYIGRNDYDDRGLVDFDKKWAEKDAALDQDEDDSDSQSDDEAGNEPAEWIDEFGRRRTGTTREKALFERQQRIQSSATASVNEDSARPLAPSNIIYGDAIQSNAFNPDRDIADKMAEIAAKRDKEATPPPDVHYDASAEIRNRGTGFYAFSGDAEMRKEEMESLERERQETERARQERDDVKAKRKLDIEERRKAIEAKRKAQSDKEADKFLDGLDISQAPAD